MEKTAKQTPIEELVPIIGAEVRWVGNVGHMTFLHPKRNFQEFKCMVSPRSVRQVRGSWYITKQYAREFGLL